MTLFIASFFEQLRLAEAWIMAQSKLRLITATIVLRTIAPRRPKSADLRTREHLTPDEVARLPVARGSCSRFCR